MQNRGNQLHLAKRLVKLKKEQKKLKKVIKDTHVEIEWLNIEMKAFTKTNFWKLAYIIKNLKLLNK